MAQQPLNDVEVDKLFKTHNLEKALDFCIKKCSLETQNLRPEEHINWWSENKLIQFLSEAGFKTILKSRYNQSISPIMRDTSYFDNTAPDVSLYIEAIK
ncbi:MAG: hypothetical protein AABX04_03220 [Nanoarchaeota archaeon]